MVGYTPRGDRSTSLWSGPVVALQINYGVDIIDKQLRQNVLLSGV